MLALGFEPPIFKLPELRIDLGLDLAPITDGVATIEPAALGSEVRGLGNHLLPLTVRNLVL
jgi:hypothetical protein